MKDEFDDTSIALLDAAHEILRAYGPEALTVRRIAAQANMSTMNVYSRFDGKHGVIDELFAEGYRRLGGRLAAVPSTDDPFNDIVRSFVAYREFALEHRSYYRVMFGSSTVAGFEPSNGAVEIAFSTLFQFTERVERAQAAGAVTIYDDWSPIEIATWIWSVAHGHVSLEIFEVGVEEIHWSRHFERGVRTALAGLRAA